MRRAIDGHTTGRFLFDVTRLMMHLGAGGYAHPPAYPANFDCEIDAAATCTWAASLASASSGVQRVVGTEMLIAATA